MNCKPGDLAIVVRSRRYPECNGMILKIEHLAYPGYWRVSGKLIEEYAARHGKSLNLNDRLLRPIRDNPGEDEMLRIVGKPTEVVAS